MLALRGPPAAHWMIGFFSLILIWRSLPPRTIILVQAPIKDVPLKEVTVALDQLHSGSLGEVTCEF